MGRGKRDDQMDGHLCIGTRRTLCKLSAAGLIYEQACEVTSLCAVRRWRWVAYQAVALRFLLSSQIHQQRKALLPGSLDVLSRSHLNYSKSIFHYQSIPPVGERDAFMTDNSLIAR